MIQIGLVDIHDFKFLQKNMNKKIKDYILINFLLISITSIITIYILYTDIWLHFNSFWILFTFSSIYWWITWFFLRAFLWYDPYINLIICIFLINLFVTYIYISLVESRKKIYIISIIILLVSNSLWLLSFLIQSWA